MRKAPAAMLLLLAAAASGCLAYNEPCAGLVENPEDQAGYLDGEVFLDKSNVRHANNAIARLAAEAFIDAHTDPQRPVELAVMNGGAIRNEGGVLGPDGQCGIRNVLPQGKVTKGDIHQILLFKNLVHAVDVREAELFEVFEHSVFGLVKKGEVIASPPGRFLNAAGGPGTEIRVDCLQPPGARVSSIRVGDRVLERNGEQSVRLALSGYLLGGGDGYSMLTPLRTDLSRHPVQAEKFGGIDNEITAAYFAARYKDEHSAFPVHAGDAERCADPEQLEGCRGPIKLVNCAVPPRPLDG